MGLVQHCPSGKVWAARKECQQAPTCIIIAQIWLKSYQQSLQLLRVKADQYRRSKHMG